MYSYNKFNENLSSGSKVVPCGRTDIHDEALVPFRNFANVPNKTVLIFNTALFNSTVSYYFPPTQLQIIRIKVFIILWTFT
jgi:hypothetical protein